MLMESNFWEFFTVTRYCHSLSYLECNTYRRFVGIENSFHKQLIPVFICTYCNLIRHYWPWLQHMKTNICALLFTCFTWNDSTLQSIFPIRDMIQIWPWVSQIWSRWVNLQRMVLDVLVGEVAVPWRHVWVTGHMTNGILFFRHTKWSATI